MPSTEAESPVINPVSVDEDHIHVVAAIIWQQGKPQSSHRKFLIAQRQKGKHLADYWEFPGGKLEPGESPWQALQRELEEEIGILPTKASPYLQVYHRYPQRNILLDTWLVEEYRGEIVSGEGQQLRWIELSQVDRYQLPPADLPIIEAIKNSAKAGSRCLP
ncbi:MAG TPA: 8-oxo-dGTP diphosphatase MutT [Gammaproteobacteria bacterium]|nr:8-oxo-dGTP diphosphatase MutT [Gammaproteobacteria bacterium]